MKNGKNQLSIERKSALTAGISLIIMALAAFYSYGIVLGNLVVEENASSTFQNITSSSLLFSSGIIGWLIILLCDIVVALCFYIFLKPINKRISLLGAWLRMIYTGILGIAVLNLILILILTIGIDYMASFQPYQLQALVMFLLKAFNLIWSFGLIIFGGHLFIVGYLTFKSHTIPKIISILLWMASISYIIIHFSYTFLPHFYRITTTLESILSVPMFLGEMSFGIWLLFKGGKVSKSG